MREDCGCMRCSPALDRAGDAVDGALCWGQVIGSGPDVGSDAAHCAARWQILPCLSQHARTEVSDHSTHQHRVACPSQP